MAINEIEGFKEYSKVNIPAYLWQFMYEPFYSDTIEQDLQFAVERSKYKDFINYLLSLKNEDGLEIECLPLKSGQPHSCDDLDEVWGEIRNTFRKLEIIRMDQDMPRVVELDNTHVKIFLNQAKLKELAKAIESAATVSVFFGYKHFITIL